MVGFKDFILEKSKAEYIEKLNSQYPPLVEHIVNWLCSNSCESGEFYNWDKSIASILSTISTLQAKLDPKVKPDIAKYIKTNLKHDVAHFQKRMINKGISCVQSNVDIEMVLRKIIESNPSSRQDVQQVMLDICNQLTKEQQ